MNTSFALRRAAVLAVLLAPCPAPYPARAQPPATAPAASDADVAAGRMDALATENRYLRSRIRELEAELDAVPRVLPEQPEQAGRITQLEGETQQLSDTVRRLREELEATDRDRASLRRMEEQASQWRQLIIEQRTRLADLQRRLDIQSERSGDVEELRTRNRQLELAIKGAEQESLTIARLQEEVRIAQAKLRVLLQERQQAQGDLQAQKRRADALADDLRREREARIAAEAGWTALRERTDTLMEQLGVVEEQALEADRELEALRRDQAQGRLLQGTHAEELRELHEDLETYRDALLAAQSRATQAERLRLQATDGQSPPPPDTALAEQVRHHEQAMADMQAAHDAAVSDLVARHAAEQDALQEEIRALQRQLEEALAQVKEPSSSYLEQIVPR